MSHLLAVTLVECRCAPRWGVPKRAAFGVGHPVLHHGAPLTRCTLTPRSRAMPLYAPTYPTHPLILHVLSLVVTVCALRLLLDDDPELLLEDRIRWHEWVGRRPPP